MAENKKGYYYCQECGSLLQVELNDPGKQTCEVCGGAPQDPIFLGGLKRGRVKTSFQVEDLEEDHFLVDHLVKQGRDVAGGTSLSGISHRNTEKKVLRKRRRKRRKRKKGIFVFILAMLSLVAIAIIAGSNEEDAASEKTLNTIEGNVDHIKALKMKQEQAFLSKAVPQCQRVMSSFLEATSVAGKAQFVADGPSLVGSMARYYSGLLDVSSEVNDCQVVREEVLSGFERSAIALFFANSSGDKWECVFVLDEGVWKIDWKFLVKYDSMKWSSFLAGKEGTVGDFRLYIRRRGGNDEFRKSEISVKFYKPKKNLKEDYDEELAPTGTMLLDSPIGKEVNALFAGQSLKDKKRKDKHGLSVGVIDPVDFCRVRLRLVMHRVGRNKKRPRIEILKVLSPDWYGIKEKE